MEILALLFMAHEEGLWMSTILPAIFRLAHCNPFDGPKQGHVASMTGSSTASMTGSSTATLGYSHSPAACRDECRFKTKGIKRLH